MADGVQGHAGAAQEVRRFSCRGLKSDAPAGGVKLMACDEQKGGVQRSKEQRVCAEGCAQEAR